MIDSIIYAIRSLSNRRLRSWLTIIGIFIGIAAVVSLISLGQGMQNAIESQFSSLGADVITIQAKGGGFGPPGLGSAAKLTTEDLEVVQKSNYVKEAAGRILRPVTTNYDGKSSIAFIASLPEDRDERNVVDSFLNPEMEEGRWLEPDDSGKVVLGNSIATDAKWRETITVGKRISIQEDKYDVVGIIKKKGAIQLDSSIIINEEDARKTLEIESEYSVIIARAESPEEVQFAKEAIMKDLRKYRGVEERKEDFEVSTSEEILDTLGTVLGVVTGVLVGIAGISLLVGGIGIMNTMYTSVLQRTREIGIMKAIGATNEQVLAIFLLESGMLGLVGAIIGVLIGIGLSKTVEFVASQAFGPNFLQASAPLWLILGALAFGFIVGTLSGVFPARRAAMLPPVEALR